MKISFDLNVIVYFAAICTGIYTSLLLFFAEQNRMANRFLALLMLAITGWIADAFFRASGIYAQRPDLYFLPIYYSFAFGPLLYLYVCAITNKGFHFRPLIWLHFVPVVLQAAFYWYMCFQSYHVKYNVWYHVHQPVTYRIEYDGTWLSLAIYLWLATRHFIKYRLWLADNYSNITRRQLNWLRLSLLTLILVCMAWLFEAFLRDFRNTYYQYDVSTNLLCIVIFCIGILGMQQGSVNISFTEEKADIPFKVAAGADAGVMRLIEQAMLNHRLYLNPELTLADVAKHLNLPPRVVSAAINAASGKAFNTYVNRHRVDEIKQRLQTADLGKFTLLGIAFESGFNSKTSFNRTFKEFTGCSPSDFLKK